MLHLIYLVAFTVLAVFAISNMIRSLVTLSADSQRSYGGGRGQGWGRSPGMSNNSRYAGVPHPELLDATGNPVNEPLLVMRSMTVEDAREQLDALYNSSPGNNTGAQEET